MTFRVMTLNVKGVYVTFSLDNTQHKRHSELQSSAIIPSVIMLNVTLYFYYAECHYAECNYTECLYAEYCYAECRGSLKLG
jgi:hypothetical protein